MSAKNKNVRKQTGQIKKTVQSVVLPKAGNDVGLDAPIARGFDLVAARKALMRKDPQFGVWIKRVGSIEVDWKKNFEPVDALARSILYQQLSGKAAATIVGRVEKLLKQGPVFCADDIDQLSVEALRSCGVSNNKAMALKDLAAKALSGVIPAAHDLDRLSNDSLITRFSSVRGIGRWTVEMMLMFRLGRPDVLPIDDLGIRKGAQKVLGLKDMPKPKELQALGVRWAPYRTLASLYLWRCVDLT